MYICIYIYTLIIYIYICTKICIHAAQTSNLTCDLFRLARSLLKPPTMHIACLGRKMSEVLSDRDFLRESEVSADLLVFFVVLFVFLGFSFLLLSFSACCLTAFLLSACCFVLLLVVAWRSCLFFACCCGCSVFRFCFRLLSGVLGRVGPLVSWWA